MQQAAGRRTVLRGVLIGLGALVVVIAVVGAVVLTNGSDGGPSSSGSTPSAAPLKVHTEVTRIAGRLPAPRRRAVEENVGALVKRYVEAAFVEGRNGVAAFPGFTAGTQALAVRDAAVLTAGSSATEVSGATARVSVFADHRRPQGATARLVLRLRAGDESAPQVLTGRLLLTPTHAGWRVFGYDVARGDHVASAGQTP